MPLSLTLIAPPLLGAFIGYLTNYVAIRMLFRPLKPWRLFGMRLPMTPGVIPAKRHDLADNIGKMVGDHLLTSDDVQKALAEENFQSELLGMISNRVEHILQSDLGPVDSLVPERFRSYFRASVKILRWRALKHLHNHIDSSQFADSLIKALEDRYEELLDRNIEELLSREMIHSFTEFLEETAVDLLASPKVEQWLTAYIDQRFQKALAENRSPADLVPTGLTESLQDRLEKETPALLNKLAGMVQEPLMQDKIAAVICRAIDSFAAALGPMASLLGNFINPAAIQEKVRDYLGNKGNEISGWLIDQSVQGKVASLLREKTYELLNTPLAELLKDVEPEKMDKGRSQLAEQVMKFLRDPGTAKAAVNLLHDSLLAQKDRDLNEMLTLLFGPDGPQEVKGRINDEIIELIRSRNFKRVMDRLLTEMIDNKLLTRPIGRLDSFLPGEVKEGINDFLLEQINDILIKEVPGLVDSLNIREIVTRKVDSLDLLKLEGLLLSIMEEQFKYINLFGALLGFIIGMFNLLFMIKV